MSVHLRRIAGVIVMLSLWEINSRLQLYQLWAPTLPSAFFPSVLELVSSVRGTMLTRGYLEDLAYTISRCLIGFISSASMGVILGLLSARLTMVEDILFYPFEFMRQLPAVALVPFVIIIFGVGSSMKIAIAFLGCIFPVFVATRNALASIDPDLLLTAKSYRWRGTKLFLGVMLPAALPTILSALRIALAIALILVIMGEMLAGGDGLGQRLVELERSFRYSALYAETLLLGIWGIMLNSVFNLAGRYVYFWGGDSKWAE